MSNLPPSWYWFGFWIEFLYLFWLYTSWPLASIVLTFSFLHLPESSLPVFLISSFCVHVPCFLCCCLSIDVLCLNPLSMDLLSPVVSLFLLCYILTDTYGLCTQYYMFPIAIGHTSKDANATHWATTNGICVYKVPTFVCFVCTCSLCPMPLFLSIPYCISTLINMWRFQDEEKASLFFLINIQPMRMSTSHGYVYSES